MQQMAKRKLVLWPDGRLSAKSEEIQKENVSSDEIQTLIKDLVETMRAENGLGLSAIQVGIPKRIVVAADGPTARVFINPTLTPTGERRKVPEGCLSVPGVFHPIPRNEGVTVRALNEHGQEFVQDLNGTLAQCLQHELEHLDGKMFLSYLPIKVQRQIREYMVRYKKGK
jgi:peptide deformylase